MRFGLKDVNELPSMEEFEKLVAESFQAELIPAESAASGEAAQPESRDSSGASEPAEPDAAPEVDTPSESLSETKKAG